MKSTLLLCCYRPTAIALALLLSVPPAFAAIGTGQETFTAQQPTDSSAGQSAPPNVGSGSPSLLVDAPQPQAETRSPGPTASQSSSAPQAAPPAQPGPPQQAPPVQPLGTAAAPAEPASGIAASRPAGAAIAPAKQKRARSFAIRVGLIIGAAVAVGTVVALSSASPSRPATH
jgi:hypothetical protein